MKTFLSQQDHLDEDLARGFGRPVTADSCQAPEDHPALMILDDQERQVWNYHVRGFPGREIGEILGLRPDAVCRMLASIKRFLELLVKFRDLVQENELLRRRFYCAVCPKGKKEEPPAADPSGWRQLTFYDLRLARYPRNLKGRFVKKK